MTEQIKNKVVELIEGIFKHLPIKKKKLTVNVRKDVRKTEEDNEREIYLVEVNFHTESPELIIGYHGKNLHAFRVLLQSFLNTLYPDHDVRVTLDIDNYFAQQLDKLSKRVRQAIEEVKLLGEPVELKPMSPKFRRHVHLIVADTDGVYSESKGMGRARHVVIYPADNEEAQKEEE